MCLICIDLAKGKLTANEASQNLKEMVDNISDDHFYEVVDLINNKEAEEE